MASTDEATENPSSVSAAYPPEEPVDLDNISNSSQLLHTAVSAYLDGEILRTHAYGACFVGADVQEEYDLTLETTANLHGSSVINTTAQRLPNGKVSVAEKPGTLQQALEKMFATTETLSDYVQVTGQEVPERLLQMKPYYLRRSNPIGGIHLPPDYAKVSSPMYTSLLDSTAPLPPLMMYSQVEICAHQTHFKSDVAQHPLSLEKGDSRTLPCWSESEQRFVSDREYNPEKVLSLCAAVRLVNSIWKEGVRGRAFCRMLCLSPHVSAKCIAVMKEETCDISVEAALSRVEAHLGKKLGGMDFNVVKIPMDRPCALAVRLGCAYYLEAPQPLGCIVVHLRWKSQRGKEWYAWMMNETPSPVGQICKQYNAISAAYRNIPNPDDFHCALSGVDTMSRCVKDLMRRETYHQQLEHLNVQPGCAAHRSHAHCANSKK